MVRKSGDEDWRGELECWLAPFLSCLHHTHQRHWAPVYLRGLLGPGERKSVTRLAERVAPGEQDQLHNFVAVAPWELAAPGRALVEKANALVGGAHAHLIVDETSWPKQGRHSVGVARQWCGMLGKTANCQVAVSLTLSRGEVPVPIALRLYLPADWAADLERRRQAGVPDEVPFAPKWKLALDEIGRVLAAGVRFGDVLADAGYGEVIAFRQRLDELGLPWAVGISAAQQVYPVAVQVHTPQPGGRGHPRWHPWPDRPAVSTEAMIAGRGKRAWRRLSWRTGTKGELTCRFAAVRARVADGAPCAAGGRLPGRQGWLIGEWRDDGEKKYYLSNLPRQASRMRLARMIRARWVCEQGHQQMKEELGLDHYEGRSWQGLHHHLFLTMVAMAFLQHLRLAGRKRGR